MSNPSHSPDGTIAANDTDRLWPAEQMGVILVDGKLWTLEEFQAWAPKHSVVINGQLLDQQQFDNLIKTLAQVGIAGFKADIWYDGTHFDDCWRPKGHDLMFGRHL